MHQSVAQLHGITCFLQCHYSMRCFWNWINGLSNNGYRYVWHIEVPMLQDLGIPTFYFNGHISIRQVTFATKTTYQHCCCFLFFLLKLVNMSWFMTYSHKFFLNSFKKFIGKAYWNEPSLACFNKFHVYIYYKSNHSITDRSLLNKYLIKHLSLILCHIYLMAFNAYTLTHSTFWMFLA